MQLNTIYIDDLSLYLNKVATDVPSSETSTSFVRNLLLPLLSSEHEVSKTATIDTKKNILFKFMIVGYRGWLYLGRINENKSN
jgi:hypothetical protein